MVISLRSVIGVSGILGHPIVEEEMLLKRDVQLRRNWTGGSVQSWAGENG